MGADSIGAGAADAAPGRPVEAPWLPQHFPAAGGALLTSEELPGSIQAFSDGRPQLLTSSDSRAAFPGDASSLLVSDWPRSDPRWPRSNAVEMNCQEAADQLFGSAALDLPPGFEGREELFQAVGQLAVGQYVGLGAQNFGDTPNFGAAAVSSSRESQLRILGQDIMAGS